MRTRVGRIMKKGKKSEAAQPQKSSRDDQIMETWSFLTQHIVLESTSTSHLAGTATAAAASTATSSQSAITSNLDAPQSPQSSGQYSWTRTTKWEPGMPPASSVTLVQAPSPTPSVSSLSATFKIPVTPLSCPDLTPGSVDSSLEDISPQPSSPPRTSTHHQSNGYSLTSVPAPARTLSKRLYKVKDF
ncbi:hypothetical protein SNE40_017488 [Patella caerulea]|uniref:Uncharacterized protein n=1 Tax=Patella caerulea TaxID=87958 RepID=A0AAN8JC92_PATCE